ncbi:MAG: Arm DNA-binding domain-containing protein [Candidatus Binataceae bacterium]
MAKVLTQAALEALKPSDKRREIPDGKVGGLYFVLQPSGPRSWCYRYRANGVARKLTLDGGALSIADARAAAKQAAADAAKHMDPAGEKRAPRLAAKAKAAVAEKPSDLIETSPSCSSRSITTSCENGEGDNFRPSPRRKRSPLSMRSATGALSWPQDLGRADGDGPLCPQSRPRQDERLGHN